MAHLEKRNLISNTHHGFRTKFSTETALTVITDEIYHSMDNRKISLLTLCDLSKAFDSVNHVILIKKCLKLKTDSFWFSSYLRDRTQRVRIKDISSKRNVDYGVPQGSMLGPILFNIFVNDVDNMDYCTLVQYADDTQFLRSGTVDELPFLIK